MSVSPVGSASGLPAAGDAQKDAKLRRAAGEFEACFARELLRPMEECSLGSDDDSDEGGGAGGSLRGCATDALADALGAGGGLGLSKLVMEKLSRGSTVQRSE